MTFSSDRCQDCFKGFPEGEVQAREGNPEEVRCQLKRNPELKENFFLSTLTFWGYGFGGKIRKLQKNVITTKLRKSQIKK